MSAHDLGFLLFCLTMILLMIAAAALMVILVISMVFP